MTERLSDEVALLFQEGEIPSERTAARALLHARLAGSLSEGLAHDTSRNGHARDDDDGPALIAAFLDGATSPAERDAIAAKLVNDAAARADLISAMALLDDIAVQPAELPAGLASRAAEIFAPDAPPAVQSGGGWMQALAGASRWFSAPGPKFALASVLVIAIATPVLLQEVWRGDHAEQDSLNDGPVGRGLVPASSMHKAPSVTAKESQDCEPSERLAVAGGAPSDSKAAPPPPAAKPTVDGKTVPSSAAPDDPCGHNAPAQNIPARR